MFWRKSKPKSEEEYRRLGQMIWTNYVPASGQSDCVQGELLRAIEKIRDEALRNGNGNWDSGHEKLLTYINDTLQAQKDVPKTSKAQLDRDVKRLRNYQSPYLEDDIYDRISNIILDWCALHTDPISRDIDPDLYR